MWSNTWQPTTKSTKTYEAIFTQAHAEFRRKDHAIETYTQISVSPEDDIELRRVTLTNRSETPRTIEVTSYAEVVLATHAQDESHPAFSNLFVQTELVPDRQAVYCTRRPRSATEQPPWMMHMMTVRGLTIGEPTYETDRMRFVGRHRTLAALRRWMTRRHFPTPKDRSLIPSFAFARRCDLQRMKPRGSTSSPGSRNHVLVSKP